MVICWLAVLGFGLNPILPPSPILCRYVIERKDITFISNDWEVVATVPEGTTVELKEFNPEKDYLYRIKAQNEYGMSEPSMPVSYYGKTGRCHYTCVEDISCTCALNSGISRRHRKQ